MSSSFLPIRYLPLKDTRAFKFFPVIHDDIFKDVPVCSFHRTGELEGMEECEIERVHFEDSFTRLVLLSDYWIFVGKKEPVQIFMVTRGDEETKSSRYGDLQEKVLEV